jgi:hypothetical protein
MFVLVSPSKNFFKKVSVKNRLFFYIEKFMPFKKKEEFFSAQL